jgi:epsilon-lactone hydrolase
VTVAQLDSLIAQLRAQPAPAKPTVADARAGYEQMGAMLGGAPDARCEKVNVGGIAAEWVAAPGADPQRVVLYLHGGAHVIGSLNTHRRLAYDISAASAARLLMIDYRLAPEHPFPAGVNDATTAWRWLLEQGFSARRLAIAGDSSGGGLTFSTLVNLRDQTLPLPACAAVMSPWVDLECTGTSVATRAERDPILTKEFLSWMAGLFLHGKDPRTPLASPLHADLAGLPPMLIQVGTAEILLDDSLRIAERLHRAGVDVHLTVWPDMPHVFAFFAPILSEGRDGCLETGNYIRCKLG